MSVNPSVLKDITKVVFYRNEPPSTNVLWAKPVGEGLYQFLVYYNGTWNAITNGEDGITINIPEMSGDISVFTNDAGYVTSGEVSAAVSSAVSGKQDTISDLDDIRENANNALQPTDLADWAKQPAKPVYTPNEVSALPATGYSEEAFVFTLADDSTVTKTFYVK